MDYFRNAIKCNMHDHGNANRYTCAVDTLADLYYYAVYQYDQKCDSDGQNPLLARLITMCEMRKSVGTTCEIREELWNWLVSHVPGYNPKGRPDAEILQAFETLQNSTSKFETLYSGYGICPECTEVQQATAKLPPVLFYEQTINQEFKRNMAGGMEKIMTREVQRQIKNIECETCTLPLYSDLENEYFEMSDFIIVSLGLDQHCKNVQEPRLVIRESIMVFGTKYILTGAVQMTPGHFYCVVKSNDRFVLVDGLKDNVSTYSTFAAAVSKKESTSSAAGDASLSSDHDGLHILIYAKCVTCSPDVPRRDDKNGMNSSNSSVRVTPKKTASYCPPVTPQSILQGAEKNPGTPIASSTPRLQSTPIKETSCSLVKSQLDSCSISSISAIDVNDTNRIITPKRKAEDTHISLVTSPQKRQSKSLSSILPGCSGAKISKLNSHKQTDRVPLSPKCMNVTSAPNRSENVIQHGGKENVKPRKLFKNTTTATISKSKQKHDAQDKRKKSFQRNKSTSSILFKTLSDDITNIRFVKICEHDVALTEMDGCIYFACAEVLRLAGIKVKKGYSKIDDVLEDHDAKGHAIFLTRGNKRAWIEKNALLTLLRDKAFYKKTLKKLVEKSVLKVQNTKSDISKAQEIQHSQDHQCSIVSRGESDKSSVCDNSVIKGYVSLEGLNVPYMTEKDLVYVKFEDVAKLVGIYGHVKKNSWKYIDACLKRNNLDVESSFSFITKKRKLQSVFISVKALLILLSHFKPGDSQTKLNTKEQLLSEIQRLAAGNVKNNSGTSMKKPLEDFVMTRFSGKKKPFLDTIVDAVSGTRSQNNSEEFDGSLSKDDILYVMKSVHDKKTKQSSQTLTKEIVYDMYQYLHEVKPDDVINIVDNYSGTRLMAEMRKKLPGVLPSSKQERVAKHKYHLEFIAILLPRRTATGWYIDPSRLLQILTFRYPFLELQLYVRMWGDGREIGGRHSTFVCLSILNDELHLRNMSYQNPNETYPFVIFYESDSRDNLEMNLGQDNFTDRMVKEESGKGSKFYLCGDEMFLIKVLDGSKQLSPTSEFGWNFYHRAGKEQKKETAPSGKRTDMVVPLDREHPESLIPSLPLKNIIFDTMHGLARIVEKLLNLEIEKVLSEGNKGQQSTMSAPTTKQLLDNLVSNINKRGVRQGNFQVHFDKAGKPESVSLNKDHALCLVSPPPVGEENTYPHVLDNVVPRRQLPKTVVSDICGYFEERTDITEYDLVTKVWDCVYNMYVIVKTEPEPRLLSGKPEGSLRAVDYQWGYTEEVKNQYKNNAECFYKLMCTRYTYKNLTPYMIKFIDYARYFMEHLEFPLCRFQAEGGEHLNYQHSRHYYQHTTRHGGKDKVDPHLSMFSTMYRKLAYEIKNQNTDEESANGFTLFVQRHTAALKIQTSFRGHMTRRMLTEKGWKWKVENQDDRQRNHDILNLIQTIHYPKSDQQPSATDILSEMTFVLVGTVPKHDGRKWTHESLEKMIESKGGRTSKCLPGNTKGRSTKMYYILVNTQAVRKSRKLPDIVRDAIHRRYIVLDYSYAFASMVAASPVQVDSHKADLHGMISNINVEPSLQVQHFSKKPRMTSLIKKRKTKPPREKKVSTVESNAAVYYAMLKRKETLKHESVSFKDQGRLVGQFCQEFVQLPDLKKQEYIQMWQEKKRKCEQERRQRKELSDYNSVQTPLYGSIIEDTTPHDVRETESEVCHKVENKDAHQT